MLLSVKRATPRRLSVVPAERPDGVLDTGSARGARDTRDDARRPLELAWPALDVSSEVATHGTLYRASLALGRQRYADPARVARAFTDLIVSLTVTSTVADESRAAMSTDEAGNPVVELRSPVAGMCPSLVVGLLQPILEAHAADRLEHGRMLGRSAGLTFSVDVSVTRPPEGGTVLRVVLHAESSVEAFRDESSLDLEEALAFAGRRSSHS